MYLLKLSNNVSINAEEADFEAETMLERLLIERQRLEHVLCVRRVFFFWLFPVISFAGVFANTLWLLFWRYRFVKRGRPEVQVGNRPNLRNNSKTSRHTRKLSTGFESEPICSISSLMHSALCRLWPLIYHLVLTFPPAILIFPLFYKRMWTRESEITVYIDSIDKTVLSLSITGPYCIAILMFDPLNDSRRMKQYFGLN